MDDYAHILDHLPDCKPGGRDNTWHSRCPNLNRHKNGDRNPSLRLWIDEETGQLRCKCYGGCTWSEIVEAIGSKPQAWFPWQTRQERIASCKKKKAVSMSAKVVAMWDYHDEDGKLVYQKCKTLDTSGNKSFFIRRPHPTCPGEWVNSLSAGHYAKSDGQWRGVKPGSPGAIELPEQRPVIYHLPEISAAKLEQPIFVVEGEKDADTLRSLKFVATTGPFGAGKWIMGHGGYFALRRVVVIPDYDAPGLNYALAVVAACVAYCAASIRLAQWRPEQQMEEGEDITDWLGRNFNPDDKIGMRQAVIDLAKASVEWAPKEVAK